MMEAISSSPSSNPSSSSRQLCCSLSRETTGEVQILISVVLVGFSYVICRAAMLHGLKPITFNAARFIVSSLMLALTHPIIYRLANTKIRGDESIENSNEIEEERTGNQVELPETSERTYLFSDRNQSLVSAYNHDENRALATHHFSAAPSVESYKRLENEENKEYDCRVETSLGNGIDEVEKVDEEIDESSDRDAWLELIFWSLLIGFGNFGGSMMQQFGMVTVPAGKSAFYTGMYVVVIPIAEFLIPGLGAKLNARVWGAAILSFIGVFLMSGCAEAAVCFGGAIREGEVFVLLGMLFWAAVIMASDVATKRVDALHLTLGQFFVCTVMMLCTAPFFEPSEWSFPFADILHSWKLIVLVGCMEGIGQLCATLGQTYSNPSKAAILISLEAPPSAILAYFALGETLTYLEISGCLLMLCAGVLASASVGSFDAEDEDKEDSKAETATDYDDDYDDAARCERSKAYASLLSSSTTSEQNENAAMLTWSATHQLESEKGRWSSKAGIAAVEAAAGEAAGIIHNKRGNAPPRKDTVARIMISPRESVRDKRNRILSEMVTSQIRALSSPYSSRRLRPNNPVASTRQPQAVIAQDI